MNSDLQYIFRRRSVRQFDAEPIPDDYNSW